VKSFDHFDARSIAEAISILRDHGGKARVMAGGTDLLGVLKDEILPQYPAALVNIKTIEGLDYVKEDNEGLSIGALAKLSVIAGSPSVRTRYPALARAAESVASPEIRSMATLGGNLCQDVRCWYYRYPHHMGGRLLCRRKGRGPCPAIKGDNRYHAIMAGKSCFAVCPSDTATALSALNAEIEIVGSKGSRWVPVGGFFTALGNCLGPNDVVTGVKVPLPPNGARQSFLKFTLRRPVDFAVASVASLITVDDGVCTGARIVLGAVAPMPLRAEESEHAILGKPLDEASAEEAARASVSGARALSRNAYKIDIVKALVKRAVLGAKES
jgi:xanthine dehydrogenase YagS FAD-binding subunit